jgi:cytochrome b-561
MLVFEEFVCLFFFFFVLVWVCAAMLAYKTIPGTKNFRKLVHLTLQFLAFCLSIIGVWAAIKFHNDKGIDNFYSLHSWLGLACLLLFCIQVFIYS